MPHALSALLHYLPRLSGRPAPPAPPPLSAHLLGRTIYRDKTERIGAARPLHFPCNRTFRCTSGSIGRPRGLCKRKNKNKDRRSEKPLRSFPSSAFRLLDRSLDGVRPESVLLRVALVSPSPPPALVAFRPFPPLLSSPFFPSPLSIRPSARPSVRLPAASLSIIVKPHSVHFLPSLMALR